MADSHISSAVLRAEGPRSLRTSVGLPAMSAYYFIRANAARIGRQHRRCESGKI